MKQNKILGIQKMVGGPLSMYVRYKIGIVSKIEGCEIGQNDGAGNTDRAVIF